MTSTETTTIYMASVDTGDRISGFPGVDGQVTVTEAWWHSKTLTHRFTFAETGEQVHRVDRDSAPNVVLHERPGFGPFDAVYQVGDRVKFRFGHDRYVDKYGIVTEAVQHDGETFGYEIFSGAGYASAACGPENMAPLDTPKTAVGQVWKSGRTGNTVTITALEDEWGYVARTREAGAIVLLYPDWTLEHDTEPAAELPAGNTGEVHVSAWDHDTVG